MKILVINAGSSSLKYQLFDMEGENVLAKGLCERIGIDNSQLKHTPSGGETVIIQKNMETHSDAINMVLEALTDGTHGVIKNMSEIAAIGHRVVHGGEKFSESVVINDDVKKAIEECVELAPLHNPPNLIGIEACEAVMPGVPQVAVFDTAFHQTISKQTYLYGIPYELYEKYKIRKYGFHGTSHKYVSQRAAKMLGKAIEDTKIITFHLGNGSSVAAVKGGKSVDTSMGFTPLSGVIMGTRSGLIDPAIVKFLIEKTGMDIAAVDNLLNKQSGVLGISGLSSDFRDLRTAAQEGSERAQLALDMFVYSVKKYIGKYSVAMGGVDAIVFTAGIGENTPALRSAITTDCGFLGIEVDEEKNSQATGIEMDISNKDSKVRTLVIPTNEELMIAYDTKKLLVLNK